MASCTADLRFAQDIMDGYRPSVSLFGDSFPRRLMPWLREIQDQFGFQFVENYAVGGSQAFNHWERYVSRRNPRHTNLAIVWVGSNDIDSHWGPSTPAQTTASYVEDLYLELTSRGYLVFVLGIPGRYRCRCLHSRSYSRLSCGCNQYLMGQLRANFIKLPPGSYMENRYADDRIHFTDDHFREVARKIYYRICNTLLGQFRNE